MVFVVIVDRIFSEEQVRQARSGKPGSGTVAELEPTTTVVLPIGKINVLDILTVTNTGSINGTLTKLTEYFVESTTDEDIGTDVSADFNLPTGGIVIAPNQTVTLSRTFSVKRRGSESLQKIVIKADGIYDKPPNVNDYPDITKFNGNVELITIFRNTATDLELKVLNGCNKDSFKFVYRFLTTGNLQINTLVDSAFGNITNKVSPKLPLNISQKIPLFDYSNRCILVYEVPKKELECNQTHEIVFTGLITDNKLQPIPIVSGVSYDVYTLDC